MTCDQVRDELSAWLDGALPSDIEAALAAHVAACDACRQERASLEAVLGRVRALPRVAAPAALAAGVAARLAARVDTGPRSAEPSTTAEAPPAEGCVTQEQLGAFLDDELAPDERTRVGDHLAACVACAESLVNVDDLASRVRSLPRATAPANFLAIVMARVDALLEEAHAKRRPPTDSDTADVPFVPVPVAARAPERREPREPIKLPVAVQRFLAAASLLVFALGSLAVATPNASAGIRGWGLDERVVATGTGPRHEPPAPPPPPPLPQHDPDRTLVLLCSDVDATRNALGAALGLEAVKEANVFGVCAAPAQLRSVLRRFELEDASKLDELVPPPADRVYGRNGEVYVGRIERRDRVGVLLATVTRGTAPPLETLGSGTGLRAEYFTLPDDLAFDSVDTVFDGLVEREVAPVARLEPQVSYETGGAWPPRHLVSREQRFAVSWTGSFRADVEGRYTFVVGSDDGARLEIDGRAVAGVDGLHGYAEQAGEIDLARGLHDLRLRYYNGEGPGACRLFFVAPGAGYAVVPQALLYDPDRASGGRNAVRLQLPARAVLRVEPASREAVRVFVALRRKSD